MPIVIQLLSSNPYIAWDTDMFLRAVNQIRSSIGVAFNVGFWIFLGLMGIIIVKGIIDHFVG